ncbi:MAG: hypothetical protein LCI02_15610 [Proteobacteria bacterium]|nr:hypothetical protein [Pseudomonadota bacterium]
MNMSCRLGLAALLALLAGCGPNSGGTGTGEGAFTLSTFGAKATSTCSSPIATSLDCGSTSLVPVGVTQLAGSGAVVFSGSDGGGAYRLTIEGNRAVLEARCSGARFEGEWGVAANGDERFYGSWIGPEHAALARAAQLWPQPVALLRDLLQVQVLDAAGNPLLGPLLLRRAASAATEPASCP